MTSKTEPTIVNQSTAPLLAIDSSYTAPDGSVYVHVDLVREVDAWAVEEHIPPAKAHERFGDIESFAVYTLAFSNGTTSLITWNSAGLRATLDYHNWAADDVGRCQWTAEYAFAPSPEWLAWTALANGQPIAHKAALERLEDLAADIVSPAPLDLIAILRGLRATASSTVAVDLRPDGTSKVEATNDSRVKGPSSVDLPSELTLAIRVLKGHVDKDGRSVIYRVPVRLRLSVSDDARLSLRLSMPSADRILEDVYADRVALAKELLGSEFRVLRAAG